MEASGTVIRAWTSNVYFGELVLSLQSGDVVVHYYMHDVMILISGTVLKESDLSTLK